MTEMMLSRGRMASLLALGLLQACIVGEKTRTVVGEMGPPGPSGPPADTARLDAMQAKLDRISEGQKRWDYTFTHDVELVFEKPVSYPVTGAIAVRSYDSTGANGPEVASVRVRNAGGNQLGVTVRYAPPVGSLTLRHSVREEVATGVEFPVEFDTHDVQEGLGFSHSVSVLPTDIVCNFPGTVQVLAQVLWASGPTGRRMAWIQQGSGAQDERLLAAESSASTYAFPVLSIAGEMRVAAGEVVRLIAYQTSGTPLFLDESPSPRMDLRYVAPAPDTTSQVSLVFVE